MVMLRVPIIVAVIGEGGSGGALGIAVGDPVLMLEHAVYSVIPPEGCAAALCPARLLLPGASNRHTGDSDARALKSRAEDG